MRSTAGPIILRLAGTFSSGPASVRGVTLTRFTELRLIGPAERYKSPTIRNPRTQSPEDGFRQSPGRVRFDMRRRFVRAQTSDLFMARRKAAFSVAVGKCALSSAA